MSEPAKKRLAVLASGGGSNLEAIMNACHAGVIHASVAVVVSNKRDAMALTRAKDAGIETILFEPEKFKTRTVMCATLAKALKDRRIDLVCLAGYLLKVEPCLIRSFPNRVLNIHPSLLPAYGGKGLYGRRVHEAVIAAHERVSGCTVHLVDDYYDHGPVVAQEQVIVEPTDTAESLAQKILVKEHELYVNVLRDVCSGKLNLDDKKETAV